MQLAAVGEISYNFIPGRGSLDHVEEGVPSLTGFDILCKLPMDLRTVVDTYEDLFRIEYPYESLIVYVKDEKTFYQYMGDDAEYKWEPTNQQVYLSTSGETPDLSMGQWNDIVIDVTTGNFYKKYKNVRWELIGQIVGGGTVDPEQIKQAVNGYLEENPVSGMTAEQEKQLNQNTTDVADLKSALEQIEDGGWSSTQIDLFEAFTNVIAYTSPDANSIVSSLISSLRSGSSDTPEGSFSIIYVLSNVTSSSKDNSIKSGEPYNTTLTANPGYELESVIVKMGGSDITSTAYSDGEITISAVTGNIVITASAVQSSASGQLPQDGLVDYFDFRNKTYTTGSGGLYYMNSDFGNGMLYSWTNQSGKQGDNIGLKGVGGNYTTERATGYPVTDNFPSTRTVCLFGKGGPSVPTSIGVDGTLNNSFLYQIKYIATDKTTKSLPNELIQYPEGFTKVGYNASFTVVSQNILKIYFDDTLHKTVDGSEIEDFESWDITPLILTSFSNYGTAYATYSKELSEVEIVEALEFFKKLELNE